MNNIRQISRLQRFLAVPALKRCSVTPSFHRSLYTPNDAVQKQGSYEGPGKTTLSILNEDYAGVVNLIDSFAVDGFRLNDNTKILGPCIVFPTQVLSWYVDGPEDINEDSLSLFTVLDPKIDVLVIGFGDLRKSESGRKSFPVDTSIILKMRQKGVNVELLTTENAIATYNYLVEEGRVVAAALIPPNHVQVVDQDVIDTKAKRKQLYGDGKYSWLASNRGEHSITAKETLDPHENSDNEKKIS